MTNAICGHKRDVLTMALEDLAHIDNDIIVGLARLPAALPEWRGAVLDLVDPAKLAEMMAEEGRRLGLWSRVDTWHEGAYSPALGNVVRTKSHWVAVFDDPATCISDHDDRECIPDICEHYGVDIDSTTMPQARAVLLQWLILSNGAREEAEQVLRGNHADPDELLNTIPAREYPEPRRLDPSPET